MQKYTCPMHPEISSDIPGSCPKCGMELEARSEKLEAGHVMKPTSGMSSWEKLKMSMTMSMGMEHGGLAGREMAKLMEEDIRNKFFFALILSIPIIAYSPFAIEFLKLRLPSPIPVPWFLFILTTPVFFYSGWIFIYSTFKA